MNLDDFRYQCVVIMKKSDDMERKLLDFEALYYQTRQDTIEEKIRRLYVESKFPAVELNEEEQEAEEKSYDAFYKKEMDKEENRFVRLAKKWVSEVEELRRKQAKELERVWASRKVKEED